MIRIPDELFESGDDAAPSATSMPTFAVTFAQAREASSLTGASAAATRALHDLDRSFDDSAADPAGWANDFETEAARIRDEQMARLPDPNLGESFGRDFDDLAAAKLATVRRIGAAREVEDARAGLDEALGLYASLAAGAASDIEARIVQDQAGATIARMDQAGFLRPGEADELRGGFARRKEAAQVDSLIEADPRMAVSALSDPARFSTLAPDLRVRLRDRAELRAEDQDREQSQAAASERQGRVAGLMVRLSAGEADRAEIMESAADGWLQPAERGRALALWTRQRDEIRQRDSDIARVNAALDGAGLTLDPESEDDRRALDRHFDDMKAAWLVAGLDHDQRAQMVADYVRAAGIVPGTVRRDIAEAFRAGDGEARLRMARLSNNLVPEFAEELDQRDLAEAHLISTLLDNGWPQTEAPDRAARLMAGSIDRNDRFALADLEIAVNAAEAGGKADILRWLGGVIGSIFKRSPSDRPKPPTPRGRDDEKPTPTPPSSPRPPSPPRLPEPPLPMPERPKADDRPPPDLDPKPEEGAGYKLPRQSLTKDPMGAEEFEKLPEQGRMDPNRIRTKQDSIRRQITGPDGESKEPIEDLIEGLKSGKVKPETLPPIRVFEEDGKIYTLDHRRLVAAREAGVEVGYQKVSIDKEDTLIGDKDTTKDDGMSIEIRGVKD